MKIRALPITLATCLLSFAGIASAAGSSYSVTASQPSNCVLHVTSSWDSVRVVSLHIDALYAPNGDTTYHQIVDVPLSKPSSHGSIDRDFTFAPSTLSTSGVAGAGVLFYTNNPRHDVVRGSGLIDFTCS